MTAGLRWAVNYFACLTKSNITFISMSQMGHQEWRLRMKKDPGEKDVSKHLNIFEYKILSIFSS